MYVAAQLERAAQSMFPEKHHECSQVCVFAEVTGISVL